MRKYRTRNDIPDSFEAWLEDVGGLSYLILAHFGWSEFPLEVEEDLASDFYYLTQERFPSLSFPLTVYRAVNLEAESVEEIAGLPEKVRAMGIYWTDNEGSARPHGGKSGNPFILRAEVDESDIDWGETIIANLNPDFGQAEQEITLRKGVPLRIDIRAEGDPRWEPLREFQVRAKRKMARQYKSEIYHGTFWDEEPFFDLDSSWSDYGAVYVSDSPKVAEKFTTWNSNDSEDVFVILKGKMDTDKAYFYGDNPDIDEMFEELIDDREQFHDFLFSKGYQAFIIPYNYPEGDDIAILDDSILYFDEVRLKFPGEEWSDWMSLGEAEDLYLGEED